MMNDLISRKLAINELWKALYEYEDKTEKQFQESEDLDVGDWIVHRGFVQNMSDIDRQTILNLPSAPRWIPATERLPEEDKNVLVSVHFLGLDQKHKTGWDDHIKENWYVDIASHIDGYWTSYSDEYKVASNRHIIVAWMPLPKPWKGSKNE